MPLFVMLINSFFVLFFMDMKDKLNLLEGSEEFKTWKADHTDDYLVHFFVMMPEFSSSLDISDLQIGYYNREKDHVTTFDIHGSSISLMPPQEAFKKEQHIEALSFSLVSVDMGNAYLNALKLQEEEHAGDKPNKTIVLLQEYQKKPIYNITFITASFNVLNIKISAIDGSIIASKKESLMSWKAPESD